MSEQRAAGIVTRRISKQQQNLAEAQKQADLVASQKKLSEMSTAKRSIYAATIEATHKLTNAAEFAAKTTIEIEDQLKVMEQDWMDFRNEHAKVIENAEETQLEAQAKEYARIMALYLASRSAMRSRIEVLKPKTQAVAIDQGFQMVKQKDPSSEIPNTWGTFAGGPGDCLKWPIFRDGFKVIHEHQSMSAALKFHYLQESLRGEAARVRGELGVTEPNYKIVWDRLVERYEDDYLIVHTLIQKMFTMQKLNKASSFGLRRILDNMRDCLGQLEIYFDTKAWNPMLVFLVMDLLDGETVREWEKLRPTLDIDINQPAEGNDNAANDVQAVPLKRKNGVPNWKQLEAFLEQQAKFLGHAENSAHVENSSRSTNSRDNSASRDRKHDRNQDRNQKPTNKQGAKANEAPNTPTTTCPLCNQPHYLRKCNDWRTEVTLTGRWDFVRDKNRCHICLEPYHGESDCYPGRRNKPCPKCPERRFHNSTLCPVGDAQRREETQSRHDAINTLSLGNVQASTGARSKTDQRS